MLEEYRYEGEYNITNIQEFREADGQEIQTLNLLSDLDFKDETYTRISIPQYFNGNNHTIQNIAYENNYQYDSGLFKYLQQRNNICHEVFISNLHFKNVTITSNYKTSNYDSTFRAGLLFASSNHPTTFTNITIVNSTLNLNENTGFAIVGALIGLNWGYQQIINQVAVEITYVQRKQMQDPEDQLAVYSSCYAGLIGYSHGPVQINNTDVQLYWDSNSTYDHNQVAGLIGTQKKTLVSDTVTVSIQLSAYQATGSEFSGLVGDAQNYDVKMRGNNYRSIHAGVSCRQWTNIQISSLQQDVYLWNNSIDSLTTSVNNIIPSRNETDKVSVCENCCATDYGFSIVLNLQQCHQFVSTYLSSNSSISQGQKDCTSERINILCDENAICQLRPYGASTLLTCECFENYIKDNNSICQGKIEELEQTYTEIDEDLMQSGLDAVTVSVACIIAALCIVALIWSIWICKNKKKFDGQKKPKKQKPAKQPKKQPKKEDSNAKNMDEYDNNAQWKPRQQKADVKNKYYDNNATLSSKYVSKLKPVQM